MRYCCVCRTPRALHPALAAGVRDGFTVRYRASRPWHRLRPKAAAYVLRRHELPA